MSASIRHFGVFFDRYYWQTAVLIARNGLARQYRNSFLGMLWTLFQPLTMVFIYALVMPMIMKSRTDNYPLYMVVSLPTWSYFSGALFGSSISILNNGETLKRCMVSSTVFAVADVLRFTYTYFISFGTMYIVALLLFAPLSPTLLLLPVFFLPVLMTIGALCIAIAFLAPYVRDIGDLVLVCLNMMLWLTPVVYPVEILPQWAQDIMQWNPFFILLHPIQMLAYQHVVPGMHEILHLLLVTFIAICVGFGIFSVCRRNYVYYL
jgi:ABC-type polysaccharide/polyol phosphate export permease